MLSLVDIAYIAEELCIYSVSLTEAFEDRNGETNLNPWGLLKTLSDLFEHLRRVENAILGWPAMDGFIPPAPADLYSLGNHGIDLLARLAALTDTLLPPAKTRAIEELALPLAC